MNMFRNFSINCNDMKKGAWLLFYFQYLMVKRKKTVEILQYLLYNVLCISVFCERVKKVPATYIKVLCIILFALCCVLFIILIRERKKAKKEKENTKNFLSVTAHDIKSPLTSIKGYADALLSEDIPQEKREQALFIISSEALRLSKIAERLNREDREILVNDEIFGICGLLRTVFLSLEGKMKISGVNALFSFGDEDEIYVRADKNLIHEALFNICDNAVKYCDGENIYADVELKGEKVRISVKNETSDDKFSDYFAKGARGNNKIQGTGLGLYISKQLIEANKSKLHAGKSDGLIAFYFDLPHIESEE